MGKFVLTNTRTFMGGADFTSNSNKITLPAEVEEKDSTNFGSAGWTEVLGGLRKFEMTGAGQWEAGDAGKVDDALWAGLGSIAAVSVFPDTANAGDLVYFGNALRSSYSLGEAVGEVAPWESKVMGSSPLVRGKGLHPPGTARTATGNGTAVQNVAVGATAKLYSALHVLSVAGTAPTLVVKVQSSVDNTFASPTDRITFTLANDRTAEFKSLAGPITDTWFRVVYTIGGTGGPSFLFVVSLGVA